MNRSASPLLDVDSDGIASIVFDDPGRPVNVLTEEVLARFDELVQQVRRGADDGTIRALIVRSGKAESFIAGADLDVIESIEDPQVGMEASLLGQRIYLDLERLPIPTVAAIDGTCLGGGTELALACRYRLASDRESTRIGLPEVQLGILPAWGGTTRLPRLVGLQGALDLLLTGKRVDARKARRIGFAEEVLPAELFVDKTIDFVRARLEGGPVTTGARRGLTGTLIDKTPIGRRLVLSTARRRVLERTGGHYPAPLRILDVLEETLGGSIEESLAAEARAAGELIVTRVSKNLVHLFRLREGAKKAPVGEPEAARIARLGVLGAGVMGGGIAQLAAYNGVEVRMKDIAHEAVSGGLLHARELFDRAVDKRLLDRREAKQHFEKISGGLTYDGFGSLDLVVEAVVERLDVKRKVLAEVEERVPPACVLATNTSSLSLDEMASGLNHPERFGGLHFFNPVHKMPLVEVVRGSATSDATIATLRRFALDLDKVPVVVRDGPGFLVNRILGPYLNEAGFLLADGVEAATIDEVAEEFGMPMGPLRLVDEIGIDIARHAGDSLHEAFGERMAPAPPLVAIAEQGRKGKKGGVGFYRYDRDEPDIDNDLYEILGPTIPREEVETPEDEIRARLFLAMINEAARCLEEGIVRRAADVDLAMVMGTGFPPFRGGLLRFADESHPREIESRLDDLHDRLGPRFEPAPVLREMAGTGEGFYESFTG